MKCIINKDTILAHTQQIKLSGVLIVQQLHVLSGHKAIFANVKMDSRRGGVPSDFDRVLADV